MKNSNKNAFNITGHVGKRPELKVNKKGMKFTELELAEHTYYFDKAKHETALKISWHQIMFFGNIAEKITERLDKSAVVYIAGKIEKSFEGETILTGKTFEII